MEWGICILGWRNIWNENRGLPLYSKTENKSWLWKTREEAAAAQAVATPLLYLSLPSSPTSMWWLRKPGFPTLSTLQLTCGLI